MNKIHRIAGNTIFLVLAESVGKICYFALFVMFSRYYQPSFLGSYISIAAMVYFSISLVDLGVSYVLVREIAKDRVNAGRYLSQGLVIVGLSIVFVLVILFTMKIFGYYLRGFNYSIVILVCMAIIGGTLVQLSASVLRGYERMGILAIITIIIHISSTIVGMSMAAGKAGLFMLVANLAFWPLIGGLVLLMITQSYIGKLQFCEEIKVCKKMLVKAVPVYFFILCGSFLQWFDLLVLGYFRNMSEVGTYGIACKVFDGSAMLISCGVAAMIPAMSVYWSRSVQSSAALYKKALRIFIALGLGGAVGLAMLADPIIVLLFGQMYHDGVLPLRILSISFALLCAGAPAIALLLSADGLLSRFWYLLVPVIVANILLNLLLAPLYGRVGSAISFVASSALGVAASFTIMKRCFGDLCPPLLHLLVRPAISCFFMATVLWYLRDFPVYFVIPAGFIAFVMTLGILGEFNNEPYTSLWKR